MTYWLLLIMLALIPCEPAYDAWWDCIHACDAMCDPLHEQYDQCRVTEHLRGCLRVSGPGYTRLICELYVPLGATDVLEHIEHCDPGLDWPCIKYDVTRDGCIDREDVTVDSWLRYLPLLAECMGGPDLPYEDTPCWLFDVDEDRDVDLCDVRQLMAMPFGCTP